MQECGLYFYLSGADNKLTFLRPEEVIDRGPRDLGQYIIENWRIEASRNEYTDKRIVRVTMTLSRNFLSIFMVTYLPTILMNMINQGKFSFQFSYLSVS